MKIRIKPAQNASLFNYNEKVIKWPIFTIQYNLPEKYGIDKKSFGVRDLNSNIRTLPMKWEVTSRETQFPHL